MTVGAGVFMCLRSEASRQSPAPPFVALKDVIAPKDAGARSDAGPSPMRPLLDEAKQMVTRLENDVHDYSAIFGKRERVDGKLSDYQFMFIKLRHKPLSVFLHFLTPDKKGDEAIFVEGQNDGKILGHTTGLTGRLVGTIALDPNGMIAMQGQRYPITEIGILNLTRRMAAFAEKNLHDYAGKIEVTKGVKVNDRICTRIRVIHPVVDTPVRSYMVQIHVDDQLQIPIRYECYAWFREGDPQPELLEEYTYFHVKINNGFTDADFDPKNPNYGYP